MIEQRRGGSEESLAAKAVENARASIEAGTTFLADMTTAGLSWGAVAAAPEAASVSDAAADAGLTTDAGGDAGDGGGSAEE